MNKCCKIVSVRVRGMRKKKENEINNPANTSILEHLHILFSCVSDVCGLFRGLWFYWGLPIVFIMVCGVVFAFVIICSFPQVEQAICRCFPSLINTPTSNVLYFRNLYFFFHFFLFFLPKSLHSLNKVHTLAVRFEYSVEQLNKESHFALFNLTYISQ